MKRFVLSIVAGILVGLIPNVSAAGPLANRRAARAAAASSSCGSSAATASACGSTASAMVSGCGSAAASVAASPSLVVVPPSLAGRTVLIDGVPYVLTAPAK